ncbi:MAG TPA: (2Fe-2S)-binding protein [Patescibacteria group bacterium]|nr:(2Fe-2S)-binding protein [Patescibacteria group bacterium]
MTKSFKLRVNGQELEVDVPENTLLSDLLRAELDLTGTHRGCDTAQCGACTVHLDGRAVKSCNVLAHQAAGKSVTTIEGLGGAPDRLHPVQQAFREFHALQCGFCTPGMVMSALDILRRHPEADEDVVRAELDGNLCRCTGYDNIVKAIVHAGQVMRR